MKYEIFGENLPAVTLHLDQGESIFTQSGGMSWMTDGIKMDTNMKGGFGKGLGRMFAGESLFMATYTAAKPNQSITVASNFPGEIHALTISSGQEYILQKNAFLCATTGVHVAATMTKSIGSGLFGGEGFVLQRLSGNGLAFAELDGSVKAMDLAPGERIIVDTGNVAMFEASVKYTIETVKGFKNILFGGEGLFLTVLEGPGWVYLQTLTAAGMASRLLPYMPTNN